MTGFTGQQMAKQKAENVSEYSHALQKCGWCGLRSAWAFVLVLLLGLVSGAGLYAQNSQQFTGHVADATGAVIVGAEVVVHNDATGIDTKTVTTDQGVYTVPYLIPGVYDISVSKDGFKTEKKVNITLNLDQTSTVDFQLTVGSVDESVTVVVDQVQIDVAKADRGEVIEAERVTEMPLDSRNPFGLFGLAAGTHDFTTQYVRPFDNVADNQYANGSLQQPELSMDGMSNEGGGDNTAGFKTNTAIVPSVDAIQEIKVYTNSFDASTGHSAGSSIDIAFKSGGNQTHGVFNYSMRRRWLDATQWQTKYQNALAGRALDYGKPAHKRDQFSVELDGPLKIPHLVNGKDKLFYMVAWEDMTDIAPNSSYSFYSLPNPQWLTGDFSGATYWSTTNNSLQPLTIYDPLTPLTPVVDPVDGKTKLSHAAFPGNKISASRIDPVGLRLLGYLTEVYTDQPNQIVSPGAGYAPWTNNYSTLQIENDWWRNAVAKIDYTPTQNDRFSFRWEWQGRWKHTNSGTGLSPKNLANMNGDGEQPAGQNAAAQWTHTFTPNLLFNMGVTMTTQKDRNPQGPSFANNIVAALGFAANYYNQLQNIHSFPYITASGLPNAAGAPNEGYVVPVSEWLLHVLQTQPNITWIRGAHSLRGGAELRFNQWSNPDAIPNGDRFAFTNSFTNQYGPGYSDASGYSSGSAIASMLLGYPNSGSVYWNNHPFYSQHYFAPWFQDDWKLSKKLTLNLGIRWELLGSRTERYNRLTGIFDPTIVNPVSASIPLGSAVLGNSTTMMGGLTFANVNGQMRSAYAMNKGNVAPRIGFAYAINNKMSIRGGVGENFINAWDTNGTSGFSASTSYTNSLDGGITPYTATTAQGLSNPIPTVLKPTGSSLGALQSIGGNSLSFWNPKYHIPAQWNYSLSFEWAPTKYDTLEVAYVGDRSPNNGISDDLNHISPAWNAACDVERTPLYGSYSATNGIHHYCDDTSTSQIANPFRGVAQFNGTGYYSSSTLSKSVFTRPYPLFGTITENGAYNNGKNWYNSLQITVSHQMAHNLTLHGTYTHAKAMSSGSIIDTVNRIVGRQISATNDVKHDITFSGVGYLPFGRGRLLLSRSNRTVDSIVNGWEVSPLITWYSGFPWRPGGNWEMFGTGTAVNKSMGIVHAELPADNSHSYKRIRGVSQCVGALDTDSGTIAKTSELNPNMYNGAFSGCSSNTTPTWVTAPNGYAVQRVNIDFGVRQPGAIRFDVNAAKNIKIPEGSKFYLTDRTNLQLRIDMLNVMNHANWDEGYNSAPTSVDFGTISKGPSGPTNMPRYMQLSARLNW